MGALAPVYSWIPEDDLLLKNAVEAGASLESLAKGAVQFSQRFTIQQLQERWHLLLYDPIVSKEASARMIEFEHSSPKSISTRENRSISGKRKPESVRKCYYSLRKRICNDPFHSTDLNFLGPPDNIDNNNNVAGTENVLFFEDPVENQFRIGDPNFDTAADHAFADFGSGDGTAHAFCNGDHCIEDLCISQNPQNYEENLPLAENRCTVDKFDPISGFFEPSELEENTPAMFDQSNGNELDFFTGFEGSQILNSPVSDCGAPFHDFGCSSPLPDIPIWDTVDDICAPNFPCLNFADEEEQIADMLALPEDNKGNTMKNSAPSADEYLAELKSSLLDLENEDELLFMDADGKDTVDRSIDSYHSLLLGPPNESEKTKGISGNPISSGECHEEQSEKGRYNLRPPILRYGSAVNPEFPELRNGVICCVLNTEDPEIPCNDDVFLLSHIPSDSSSPSTIARWKFHEPESPTYSPSREFFIGNKVNDYVPKMIKREWINLNPFPTTSHFVGPQLVHDTGLNRPLGDQGVNVVSTNNLLPAKVDEEVTKTEILAKNLGCNNSDDICIEKKDHGFDPSCNKQDVNVAEALIENREALHAEVGPVEMNEGEQLVKPHSQDQEAFSSEADEDEGVPYFSDVEAMILEMDLSPDDDWSARDEMIARYQDEETKRKIIRLECCAAASMQRALVSEGAFAVLYGRESKHYIKKPEVLLGRSTEDLNVDVDIGRHHSNKISRRQAIIELDKGGSFHLKNFGRHSIFVNGRELATKRSLILPSGCLIDIRGITFIFEACRKKVEEYVNKMASQN